MLRTETQIAMLRIDASKVVDRNVWHSVLLLLLILLHLENGLCLPHHETSIDHRRHQDDTSAARDDLTSHQRNRSSISLVTHYDSAAESEVDDTSSEWFDGESMDPRPRQKRTSSDVQRSGSITRLPQTTTAPLHYELQQRRLIGSNPSGETHREGKRRIELTESSAVDQKLTTTTSGRRTAVDLESQPRNKAQRELEGDQSSERRPKDKKEKRHRNGAKNNQRKHRKQDNENRPASGQTEHEKATIEMPENEQTLPRGELSKEKDDVIIPNCLSVSADVLWRRLESEPLSELWRHRVSLSGEGLHAVSGTHRLQRRSVGHQTGRASDDNLHSTQEASQIFLSNTLHKSSSDEQSEKSQYNEDLIEDLAEINVDNQRTQIRNKHTINILRSSSDLLLTSNSSDRLLRSEANTSEGTTANNHSRVINVNKREKRNTRHNQHNQPLRDLKGKHIDPTSSEEESFLNRNKSNNSSFLDPEVVSQSSDSGAFTTKLRHKRLDRGSWQCQLETHWKRMPEGFFPPYIETGRCAQQTCMMNLYSCVPKHYVIKVLKRVDASCNPVPTTSRNSTYEDVWTFADYSVIVGCDCAKLRKTGRFKAGGHSAEDSPELVEIVS